MIVIVDYGMGNLGSIANMLKRIGAMVAISANADEIVRADKLILPGVGAFDAGMRELRVRGLDSLLTKQVLDSGTPILGICLGAQLMTRRSEEGVHPGLGWLDAETIRFAFSATSGLRIPHMGWNRVRPAKESLLLHDLGDEPRFYFAHSYHLTCRHTADVLFTTHHGYDFASAIEKANIIGVQFHPEKSHKFGLQLLHNFVSAS